MQVPHNAVVVVADGRKMLLLRNEGDGEYPNLTVERAQEHPNPRTGDQATDSAGRSSSTSSANTTSAGGQGNGEGGHSAPARSSFEPTDFHQLEEDRFAAEVAELLRKQALARKFDKLVIVAPPKTLVPYQVPDLTSVEEWLADNEVLDPEGPDEMFEALSKRGLFRRFRLRRPK